MIIQDRIYGPIAINQAVIAELIESMPMLRLKHISQDGASHFIQPLRNVTRFEHSVGAWYLSSHFNRPIEEQIASLLHDIPHTAFSHVIDLVMDDLTDAYHDKFTKQVILDSEIPTILKKHGIKIERVLNKENYDLLENDLPDISVDRWDYFMRDSFMFGLLPKETVRQFLSAIKEKEQKFYFDDARTASLFAVMYLNACRLIWLDPSSHGSYELLAEALRIAWHEGALTQEDFFGTDAKVMGILQASNNPQISALLARLRPDTRFRYAPEGEAEFYSRNKPRYVDPWIEQDGDLVRLSAIVPGLKQYFDEFAERYRFIGVVQT